MIRLSHFVALLIPKHASSNLFSVLGESDSAASDFFKIHLEIVGFSKKNSHLSAKKKENLRTGNFLFHFLFSLSSFWEPGNKEEISCSKKRETGNKKGKQEISCFPYPKR